VYYDLQDGQKIFSLVSKEEKCFRHLMQIGLLALCKQRRDGKKEIRNQLAIQMSLTGRSKHKTVGKC